MVAKGWIKPSVSPYINPILFVQKKTRELQMYTEFSAINTIIK